MMTIYVSMILVNYLSREIAIQLVCDKHREGSQQSLMQVARSFRIRNDAYHQAQLQPFLATFHAFICF